MTRPGTCGPSDSSPGKSGPDRHSPALSDPAMSGLGARPAATPSSPTTVDAFLGGAIALEQFTAGYRAGLDAVLLAASVAAGPGQRVLDAGAGVGLVGLAIAQRTGADVVLVERAPALASLAAANVARNGLHAQARVVTADLIAPLARGELATLVDTFDHVVANPPYQTQGQGTPAPDRLKAGAHAMGPDELDDWLRCLAALARPGGRLALIHRADALAAILAAAWPRFGDLAITPVQPRIEQDAHRVLITGIKGSRAPLRLRPAVVLHDAGGRYLPAIEDVLRGRTFPWNGLLA
jgi:tRNA1(Val) A37 N6-methylase TrmN6